MWTRSGNRPPADQKSADDFRVAIRLHPSGTESLSVLDRGDEGLDHLSVDVVAVELIQLC